MIRLSIHRLFVAVASTAAGVGLCVILAACSPSGEIQEADLSNTATIAPTALPTSQPAAPASSGAEATDSQPPTVISASTATSTTTARPTATSTPVPTQTATAAPSPTPADTSTATLPPAPTSTSTSRPTATPAPTVTPGVAAQAGQGIIIDHTSTDLDKIPDHWLEEAKKLAIHYGHTSHGLQINDGVAALAVKNPKYGYWIFKPRDSAPTSLPSECDGVVCIYDGSPPWDGGILPDEYWSTEEGRNRTRGVADSGSFGFSMWSWCGQQSVNPPSTVQLYLDTMHKFEEEYPDMRFILMTGHTDGGSSTLEQNNNMVRQYARDNDMVLFDFADIESYAPDGTFYPDTDDNCAWCSEWCTAHPEDCTHLPDSCEHSHPFNCMRKANAFWWMMARLAGWDGN